MDCMEFGDTVGVGDVDGAKVFRAETGETLFSNGNADFLNTVDMGDFGENFFLFGVESKQRQIFRIEQTQDVFMQIEENVVEITGRLNLSGNAFDVFRVLDFLLQLVDILGHRLGVHPAVFSLGSRHE